MQAFCMSCDFSERCDKEGKSFLLETTKKAFEIYNIIENRITIDFLNLPNKSLQLFFLMKKKIREVEDAK